MPETSTSVHCEHCDRDVPVLYRDPRCPNCLAPVDIPVTRKGQPLAWVRKTVVGSLAAVYATYHFYSVGGIEAAIAVPGVILGVYALNTLSEKFGWGGWGAWGADTPPYPPEVDWLEDAYASRQRGTGIATLAVRYGVDPDWLSRELSRFAPTPRV